MNFQNVTNLRRKISLEYKISMENFGQKQRILIEKAVQNLTTFLRKCC